MESTTDQVTPAPKPTRHPKLALLSLILIIAAAGGGWWYGHRNASTTTTPTATAHQPSTEKITQTVNLSYIPTGQQGLTSVSAKLSLSAPINWRTTIDRDKTSCFVSDGSDFNYCSGFSFANALGTPATLERSNDITVYDLATWLSKVTPQPQEFSDTHLGQVYSPADKAKVMAATEALTSSSTITAKQINDAGAPPLFNPFYTNAAIAGISNIQPLQSADGKLHGYSYIATVAQAVDYNPRAYVVLVGKVGNATIALGGSFQLNDQRRADFNAAVTANNSVEPSWLNSYSDGFKYGADTISQYDQVLSAVKTLTVN